MANKLEPGFKRVLWELRDYLPELVVVGGWVPYLYREFGGFTAWKAPISLTHEVDMLVGVLSESTARPPLERLLRERGFKPAPQTANAVWENDPMVGEKIEFLMANAGPAKWEGTIRPLPTQGGISAVALDDLRMLERHLSSLDVPYTPVDGSQQTLIVRVPVLGAYALNKALTFNKRRQRLKEDRIVDNPKRAKDLLYLHDVFAGGSQVTARIESDLKGIHRDRQSRMLFGTAAAQLRTASRGNIGPLADCADMLAERDGWPTADARARIQGYLTDFAEILASFSTKTSS